MRALRAAKKARRVAHGMKKRALRAAKKAKRAAHGMKKRALRAAKKAGRAAHGMKKRALKKARRAAYIRKMRAGKPITRGASPNPRYISTRVIRKYKRSSKAMRMRRHR